MTDHPRPSPERLAEIQRLRISLTRVPQGLFFWEMVDDLGAEIRELEKERDELRQHLAHQGALLTQSLKDRQCGDRHEIMEWQDGTRRCLCGERREEGR
jgi:hypothetical protein